MHERYHNVHYHGIGWLFRFEWQYRLWSRLLCRRGHHLWSEVLGTGADDNRLNGWAHYLVCDACQLMIHIHEFEETYCTTTPRAGGTREVG